MVRQMHPHDPLYTMSIFVLGTIQDVTHCLGARGRVGVGVWGWGGEGGEGDRHYYSWEEKEEYNRHAFFIRHEWGAFGRKHDMES